MIPPRTACLGRSCFRPRPARGTRNVNLGSANWALTPVGSTARMAHNTTPHNCFFCCVVIKRARIPKLVVDVRQSVQNVFEDARRSIAGLQESL